MFHVEKAYWNWKISYNKPLDKVREGCAFGESRMAFVTWFSCGLYSTCNEGCIFDGLKMDMISFAEELLNSDSWDEQLTGAQILHKFATNDWFTGYTLWKIGTSTWEVNWDSELENPSGRGKPKVSSINCLETRRQEAECCQSEFQRSEVQSSQ